MKIIRDKISLTELKTMSEKMFNQLVKAVVDVEQEIMIVDAELHSDQEEVLLEMGSLQKDLWGINIYPAKFDKDWIEFDSMINLRPLMNNRTRSIENENLRKKIATIVNKLVIK